MKADLCMFNETAAYAYGQRFLQLWQADGTNTLEQGIYNMLQLCLILYPVQIYAELLPTDSSGNITRAQHILYFMPKLKACCRYLFREGIVKAVSIP